MRTRILRSLTALLGFVAALTLLPAPAAHAAPPAPPSLSTIQSYLNALPVRAEANQSTYDRDLFPHWISQGNNCNTREVVLRRDGTNVVTDANCAAVSGTWYSVYDGATVTSASGIQIDHVVALAEAWRSGAHAWTTTRRQAFANDLNIAQLIAVSGSSNQAKSDYDPSEWVPPRTAYHCTYAKNWIWVKYSYGLAVDSAEKSALQTLLGRC
ncbi:HNH endonuclease family protein [Allostreptomyces psammosilenae]|uniref:GmrSD restriction endonucleases C-terminal domain-containing protein n=1 Tax=Allostreptomyces psammosilenae TaxID=1892865 RepID=A0A853A3M4_9ACTN|nr:HNH endonuclease family protein [Allostreptomyces psammosilenae]NYI05088.1 hypothetical protein [Allostreptomyces psammosilenae]